MELKILPEELQEALFALSPERLRQATELRFRMGRPVTVVFPWGEEVLSRHGRTFSVTDRLLRELVNRATGFSPYAYRVQESGLFLPLEGGCRLGLCGDVVLKDGRVESLRHLGSAVIRLAREHRGIAAEAARRATEKGYAESVLILSPPGRGKTTFLRDLIRCVSHDGFRVGVVDERFELSASREGVPQMDLGPRTDVLSGCPKKVGLELFLRVMNPQVLAVDELGQGEQEAAMEAANSGVALFATAHGASLQGLLGRQGFRELLTGDVFSWCVTIGKNHFIQMERLGYDAEDLGGVLCGSGIHDERMAGPTGAESAVGETQRTPNGAGTDAGRDGTADACGSRFV